MIYKNYSETAQLLAQKIKEFMEEVETHDRASLPKYSLTFINQESGPFAQKIAEILGTDLNDSTTPKNLIIIDNGATLAQEYNEFTDEIKKTHPSTNIIIAIPIIPESEKEILEKNCDTLLYLHADPYFFSLDQFYEEHSF